MCREPSFSGCGEACHRPFQTWPPVRKPAARKSELALIHPRLLSGSASLNRRAQASTGRVKLARGYSNLARRHPGLLQSVWRLRAPGDKGFLSRDITVLDLLMNRSDVHHIYPRSHLKKQGLSRSRYNQLGACAPEKAGSKDCKDTKDIKAVVLVVLWVLSAARLLANFVLARSEINIAIGHKAPGRYFKELAEQCAGGRKKHGGIIHLDEMRANLRMHCLPVSLLDGEIPAYDEFLEERRKLMAEKIRRGGTRSPRLRAGGGVPSDLGACLLPAASTSSAVGSFGFHLGQRVKLVQLGLEQSLIGEARLIFGDQGGRERAAEGVFDDLAVFAGAQEDADGGAFVRLAHIAVESLQIELQLAKMLGLELADLELEGD